MTLDAEGLARLERLERLVIAALDLEGALTTALGDARKLDDDLGLEDEAQRLRGQLPELLADAIRYRDYVSIQCEALNVEARS